NSYFADSGRVTVSLSSSESMAGIDGKSSIDALAETLAADAGSANDAAPANEPEAETGQDPAPDASANPVTQAGQPGEAAPVSIVAQPSASSPLVDVSFVVHAGAAMDPEGKKGLASLTAAMIAEGGSTSHTIQEINDAMYPIA